jgi:hypothetical protein
MAGDAAFGDGGKHFAGDRIDDGQALLPFSATSKRDCWAWVDATARETRSKEERNEWTAREPPRIRNECIGWNRDSALAEWIVVPRPNWLLPGVRNARRVTCREMG